MSKLDWAAIYLALNLLLILGLALLVVRARWRYRVSLGEGGEPKLQQAVRAHANHVEHAPAALIGLVVLALLEPIPLIWIHAIGATLTLGRLADAFGLLTNGGVSAGRSIGVLATWAVLLAEAASLIYAAVS